MLKADICHFSCQTRQLPKIFLTSFIFTSVYNLRNKPSHLARRRGRSSHLLIMHSWFLLCTGIRLHPSARALRAMFWGHTVAKSDGLGRITEKCLQIEPPC